MLGAQRRRQRYSATEPRISLRRRMPNGGPLSIRAQSVSMRTWSACAGNDWQLKRLVNTTATVFKEPTDDEVYVLVVDRWFRAWTTDGP